MEGQERQVSTLARILNIFDIGPFIHAGMYNTHSFINGPLLKGADGFRETRIPTGGIAQLLNTVKSRGNDGICLFVADRNPTIKKGMLPEYKSNREHKESVLKQKELAEYILSDIGYDVLYEEGYEADDIIYSLVKEHKNYFDQIYIYTSDSDLYFLVSDNVSIRKSSSRAKDVDMTNYGQIVNSKEYTPYNTLTFSKIMKGDKSDCIPPLYGTARREAQSIMERKATHPLLGEKWYLEYICSEMSDELKRQIDLVFPLTTDVPKTLTDHSDLSKLATWGGLCKAKMFTRVPDVPKYMEPLIDEIIANKWYED